MCLIVILTVGTVWNPTKSKTMKRFIGIGQEFGELGQWYTLNFVAWCYMVKITLYTSRNKMPSIYVYNKAEFNYLVNEQEVITFRWFAGITFEK